MELFTHQTQLLGPQANSALPIIRRSQNREVLRVGLLQLGLMRPKSKGVLRQQRMGRGSSSLYRSLSF